jgi:16S rRNA (uracil1498-N3)-methyltransferase
MNQDRFMARRRFFVSEVTKGGAVIEGEDARHLTRVLRVETGQRYEISDGERVYLAEVAAARKEFVDFHVIEDLPPAPRTVRVTLLASLIKFDHFELLIEKATELGVFEIVPVIATRTEAGLEKAVPKRMERWRRIAIEASQQSRRDRLPKIRPAVQLGESLAWDEVRYRFWLDQEAGGVPLWTSIPLIRSVDDSVALLVGPEGGWTDAERATACRRPGWTRIWMGSQILRAETAAIAGLSVIMSAWQPAARD